MNGSVPICPYCKAGLYHIFDIGPDAVVTCPDCGKRYAVTCRSEVTYQTMPVETSGIAVEPIDRI